MMHAVSRFGRTTLAACVLATSLTFVFDCRALFAAGPMKGLNLPVCNVAVSMISGENIGLLDFEVDYSRIQGAFVGQAKNVGCRVLAEDAAVQVTNSCQGGYDQCQWGDHRSLRIMLSKRQTFHSEIPPSLDGIHASSGLVSCQFYSAEPPPPDAFQVVLKSATRRADGLLATPGPQLQVTSVTCPGVLK